MCGVLYVCSMYVWCVLSVRGVLCCALCAGVLYVCLGAVCCVLWCVCLRVCDLTAGECCGGKLRSHGLPSTCMPFECM